jgi:hypothetical protein
VKLTHVGFGEIKVQINCFHLDAMLIRIYILVFFSVFDSTPYHLVDQSLPMIWSVSWFRLGT